jgi:hypothetical protein
MIGSTAQSIRPIRGDGDDHRIKIGYAGALRRVRGRDPLWRLLTRRTAAIRVQTSSTTSQARPVAASCISVAPMVIVDGALVGSLAGLMPVTLPPGVHAKTSRRHWGGIE